MFQGSWIHLWDDLMFILCLVNPWNFYEAGSFLNEKADLKKNIT